MNMVNVGFGPMFTRHAPVTMQWVNVVNIVNVGSDQSFLPPVHPNVHRSSSQVHNSNLLALMAEVAADLQAGVPIDASLCWRQRIARRSAVDRCAPSAA